MALSSSCIWILRVLENFVTYIYLVTYFFT